MSTTATANDVPANYDEFHRMYFEYIKSLVKRAGIVFQNVDDVAMGLVVRFIEMDILKQYTPQFTDAVGVVRSVKFRTYLTSLVMVYVKHPRHRLNVHYRREVADLDDLVRVMEHQFPELQGPSTDEVIDRMTYEDMLYFISVALSNIQSNRSALRMDELFLSVASQVEDSGKYNVTQLAKAFHVSTTSIRAWLTRLEREVRALGVDHRSSAAD
jgi:hypothetical protein